jgi:hypothetical protein
MIDTLKPQASFTWTVNNVLPTYCEVELNASSSLNADSIYWDYGFGIGGSGFSVVVQFPPYLSFGVKMQAWRFCELDSTYEFLPLAFLYQDIRENQLQGISIYPNPTTNKIRVAQYGQSARQADYKIYSLQGALLMKDNDASEIDVSHLARGLYILEVTMDGASSRQRFVKE